MATAKIVLYKSKLIGNNEHPVMLRLNQRDKIKYIASGYSCTPEKWDKETWFQQGVKNKVRKNNELFQLLQNAEDAIRKLEKTDHPFTAEMVKKEIRTEHKSARFFEFADEVISNLTMARTLGNASVYQTALNKLKKFRKERDMTFEDMDYHMLSNFETFCKSKGNSTNTISNYLRTLRAIYNKAIKSGVASKELYPFNQYKITYREPAKRAISKEDLIKIRDAQLIEGTGIWHAQKMFMFQFYTMGMNWTRANA